MSNRNRDTTTGVARKTSYHHGSLRDALVDAAVTLIAERGPREFTLAEAAGLAGVSVAAPYRHFKSKEALLAAVAADGFDRMRAALEAAATATSDPVDRLVALGVAYVDFAADEHARFQVMFSLHDRIPTPAEGLSALDVLRGAVADLAEPGLLRMDVDTTTQTAWALVHGIATLRAGGMRTFEGTPVEPVLRSVVEGGLLTGR